MRPKPTQAAMGCAIKPFRVGIAECRGTAFEVGRAPARSFAATPKGRAFLRRRTIRYPWWFNLRTEQRAFAKFSPALWEEIGGIADGLGITMERAVFCFGNDGLRPPIGACSAAVTATVYGRNYDFKRHYGARFIVVQAAGSYASVGSSELLTGRLDGMNQHGLIIGLHLVRMRPRFPGLSCVLIVRIILDQCATTAEAVAMLRHLPHAMQYNYSLLDVDGIAAVVEAVRGCVAVRTGPWLACTNHFQSPLLRPLNRHAAHSQQRLPPLEQWAARGLSGAEAMFSALNRSASPAFHHSYLRGAGTLHPIVGEPAKRRMLIGIGGDAAALEEDMLDVDLGQRLGGKDLPIAFLQGQLGGMSRPFEWPIRRVREKPARPSLRPVDDSC